VQLLLRELEQQLDETCLLQAEKFLDEGLVRELKERERHLWVAKVADCEVEMQVTPSKVKACSCTCPDFSSRNLCGHTAAGLLYLRQLLSAEKQAEEKKSETREGNLSINAILGELSREELLDFVNSYARIDRQFSLTLKTRFAGKVQFLNNRQKYERILEQCLQPIRHHRSRPSISAIQFLKHILETLLSQASHALALQQYAEVWQMLSAILDQLAPLLRKIQERSDVIHQLVQQAFSLLQHLVQSDLPRTLREEMWLFALGSFSRPAYYLNDLSGSLLELAARLADEEAQRERLLEVLESDLERVGLPASHRGELLYAKVRLLQEPAFAAAMETFKLHCLSSPAAMQELVDLFESRQQLDRVWTLLEEGIRQAGESPLRQRLQMALLQAAQQRGDHELATQLSRQLFLEIHRFEYLENCRKYCAEDWGTFVQGLAAELTQPQHLPTLAQLLAREKMTGQLLQLLQAHPTVDLLLLTDRHLLPKYSEALFQLYERALKDYLSSHLGPASGRSVRQVMEHLRALGQNRLSERLSAALSAAFPGRTSLLRPEAEAGRN
jgi:hypothetical protein